MEFTSGKAEEPWKSMELQEKGGKKRCKESRKDVQMDIYQSNTYQKDLSRLHFNKEQRVQKKKKKKKWQTNSLTHLFLHFVQHIQVVVGNKSLGMTTKFHARLYDRFLVKSKERNCIE